MSKKLRILVACEESQAVTIELRKLGHETYSNDILECSGGHPEWHIKGDLLSILDGNWDMIIAFPPCTYLTNTANVWLRHPKHAASRNKGVVQPLDKCEPHPLHPKRRELREEAAKFFLAIANADCPMIAIENPIGYMNDNKELNSIFKKPPVMHPYHFGHPDRKSTMYWVKGLPFLVETNNVKDQVKTKKYKCKSGKIVTFSENYLNGVKRSKAGESSVERSKTPIGIAKAMAEQWAGNYEQTKR